MSRMRLGVSLVCRLKGQDDSGQEFESSNSVRIMSVLTFVIIVNISK